jgi:hypothetical protein
LFRPEYLEKLSAHAIGQQRVQAKDGTEAGWTAGEDILDWHPQRLSLSEEDRQAGHAPVPLASGAGC